MDIKYKKIIKNCFISLLSEYKKHLSLCKDDTAYYALIHSVIMFNEVLKYGFIESIKDLEDHPDEIYTEIENKAKIMANEFKDGEIPIYESMEDENSLSDTKILNRKLN